MSGFQSFESRAWHGDGGEQGNGDRKYYFAAALSATLRYYVSDSFYCGFDARFVGLNSSVGKQDKFMYNPEFEYASDWSCREPLE